MACTAALPASASNFFYAQTTQTSSYNGLPPILINGLSINLPAASQIYNTAVVTLSMPNLTVTNCSANSATITLVGDTPAGVVFGYALIGCDSFVAASGPKPATIVLKVALGTSGASAFADWQVDAPNTVINNSKFASISAVLVKE